jgi:DNA-binding XRE family transcriptional regulator
MLGAEKMRHTEMEITFKGMMPKPRRFVIPATLGRKMEAMLERELKIAKIMAERDSIPAEEVFPDLFDPVKGPATCLRGARYRQELTQKQLADLVGIRQHHLSEMENGKRPIGKPMAKKLAAALNVNWKLLV